MNPNGGGIRNQYGVWNYQRWLRSARIDLFAHKYKPAPLSEQIYADPNKSIPSLGKEGPPLIVAFEEDVDEKKYERTGGPENTVETSEEKHLERIAKNDPFREERLTFIAGGGDFRYNTASSSRISDASNSRAWLMGADLGLRVRPMREKLSFVFESRFLSQPTNTALLQGFTSEARIRSAYILVDDLPLNSYAMYGLYRPMFGWYTPDHYSLSQTLKGLGTRAVFNCVGIGAAPNIPFANFNLIFSTPGSGYDRSSGFVVNIGGRWVTLGASILLSFWSTHNPNIVGQKLSREMVSLSGGLKVWRFTWNFELLRVDRESSPGVSDAGGVFTSEILGRVFRENYVVVNTAFSNVARDLSSGKAKELMVGIRSFPLPGLEVEALLIQGKNEKSTTLETTLVQTQLHLFF